MSLSDSFRQGLSTPVPVAGAGLPTDLTLYVGGPLDPLKAHEAKYKQLDRMQRMSDRESKKMLAEAAEAEHQYYGDREEEDMDKVSYVPSHPLLRRQYLLKMAQGINPPPEPEPAPPSAPEPLGRSYYPTPEPEPAPKPTLAAEPAPEFEVDNTQPVRERGQRLQRKQDAFSEQQQGSTDARAGNTAYRRALGVRDINTAYNKQLGMPPPPPEEKGYWDRTKGFFSDVGDSLKGMGSRVVRQGTQGLQQAANYGLRNSEFLEGLVDDDQEARLMSSLAQGATGANKKYYLDQLDRFTGRGGANLPTGRSQAQQTRMEALRSGDYNALRDQHLVEQATKRYGTAQPITPEIMKEMDEEYGQAFDMYYGRGDEAKRLGIRSLDQDSFGAMYDDAGSAYRRARDSRAKDDQVATDPKRFVAATSIKGDTEGLSGKTQGWINQEIPELANTDNPVALGTKLQVLFDQGDPKAMQALEMIGTDLGPQQMTRVLMTAMPQALQMGKQLEGMSDEEAIAHIQSLHPRKQEQLDKFIDLANKYIAPNMRGSQEGFGTRTQDMQDKGLRRVNRVRRATDEDISEHGGPLDYAASFLPGIAQYRTEDNTIDNELGWTGFGSGEGKFYRVPGTGDSTLGLKGTLYFNPQTGEFNREWGPSNYAEEELPSRYSDALHQAMQRAESRWLPTAGMWF